MDRGYKPPYVSYRTFQNFVDQMRDEGIPPRLDSSVMRKYSGSVQSQLKTGLRFLGFIDDEDRTTPQFRDFVTAEGEDRKQLLKQILVSSYSFLFNNDQRDFDLTVATPQQFSEKFRETGISGDTLRKAEAFFINLASEVELELSKRIVSGRTSGDKPRKKRTSTKARQKAATDQSTSSAMSSRNRRELMLDRLMEKFPGFDPDWDEEAQKKWFDQFGNLMDVLREEYPDEAED